LINLENDISLGSILAKLKLTNPAKAYVFQQELIENNETDLITAQNFLNDADADIYDYSKERLTSFPPLKYDCCKLGTEE